MNILIWYISFFSRLFSLWSRRVRFAHIFRISQLVHVFAFVVLFMNPLDFAHVRSSNTMHEEEISQPVQTTPTALI